ncbi:helix-turn-helix transcriptional regulator [Microvirga sp. 2YAF29]|uniref:helix-turn-helix transcriptional regulator n=1 Tax=Microvirga sp. 2YAF29 TaxID=3233031 RepID=UPI003F95CF9F
MASPDFDSEQLCRLLAVSRSKLYRILECSGGVARFINRERLRDAHRRLGDPVKIQSIHSIAQDVGFEDHSTFSRAFRREFGYSPSEAREKAMAKFSQVDHCHSHVKAMNGMRIRNPISASLDQHAD